MCITWRRVWREERAASRGRVVSCGVITRVAVVPYPPLLVPELAPGYEQETASLREAVLSAARWLTEVSPQWLAVGAYDGPATTAGPESHGTFAGYGVHVPVSLGERSDGAVPAVGGAGLPLPALVAGWLRERAGAHSVRVELLDSRTPVEECVSLGKRLAADSDCDALLVLGDGSHRHGEFAPGRPDDRAPAFDTGVAAALAEVDLGALRDLDAELCAELGAVGRAPWQVAAGVADGQRWRGSLIYSGAPFGVGYHVVTWELV